MQVTFIKHPWVFTDTQQRLNFNEINGTPKVGSELQAFDGMYHVTAITNSSDCVNGVCDLQPADNKR